MSSLIHLFKLRKNQVLNILLIICIFLDVAFLLLLYLIDWYLMASDTKVLFYPGYKRGLSVHTVGMYFFLLVNFVLFGHFQPKWVELCFKEFGLQQLPEN